MIQRQHFMRALRIVTTLIVFTAALYAPAAQAKSDATFHYLNPQKINLTVLLPPPPDLESNQQLSDQRQVAKAVANRTETQLETAEQESKRTVFFFAPSVGPGFSPERLPVMTAFFHRVDSDVEKLIGLAKVYWARPRPPMVREKAGSYPSGHAAFAAATAIILSAMLPSKRDAIFNQARHFAEYRIILGVHYPTDIASGWTGGTVAAYAMMQNPVYQRDFAAAKAELQAALKSH
jgi:acid phosphatase (class A)